MADETGSPPLASGTATAGAGGSFVALRSGLTIRHYIIEEVIGSGGFGITYRARHERLTSKVFALKEFFPRQFAARQGTHVISTPDGHGLFRWGLDRFLKEAEALAKCEHPGIVDVVDYFEENGTAYAVLGYVEGQQLGQWLDSLGRPPTQAELDRVLMPLLDALEVVHGAKLLHRDIAPDNILIRRDGSPCLIDFGACREDIRDRSQKLSAIVKHGYSPPEQYHGIAELQGPWTDIYAVAATVYRAISGQPPMDSSRRGALGDTLEPVSQMATEGYRPGFLAAIDAALSLKPDQRPQSIADWRAMLLSDAPPISAYAAPLGTSASPANTTGGAGETQLEAAPKTGTRSATSGPSPTSSPAPGQSRAQAQATSESASTSAAPPTRRGPLIAVAAVLALIAIGTAAWLRGGDQTTNVATSSPTPGGPSQPKTTLPTPSAQPPSNTEALAQAAWRPLAESNDIAAIERFLAEHGSTATAAPARARLASLREAARRAEEAKAAADRAQADAKARNDRQQTLDENLKTCREAPEAARATSCAAVIQSNDTPAHRAEALHLVGMAARNAGQYDEAIKNFTQSLALVPDDAQVLNDRGIAHFLKGEAGDRDEAMKDYDRAIQVNPRHAEALNNRAWSHFQAGRRNEALADSNRSIEAMPSNGYAYDTRGHIFEALGRKDEAIRDYESALRFDASQETSRSGLARLKASNP